jgi:hypothetical protein
LGIGWVDGDEFFHFLGDVDSILVFHVDDYENLEEF